MTYLQLVNSVLRRLRQSTVAAVPSSTYSTLIGDLVNQSKREVEDAFRWSHLRVKTTFTVFPGVDNTVLSTFGKRFRIERVYNSTNRIRMLEKTTEEWDRMVETTQTGAPNFWRIETYSGGDPVLEVYPTPTALTSIQVTAYVSTPDMDEDSDDLSVPDYPVILGAYALAVSERGEDEGQLHVEARRDYQSALNDAIAMDNNIRGGGRETDWHVE